MLNLFFQTCYHLFPFLLSIAILAGVLTPVLDRLFLEIPPH